jgi:8-oxo-dGTP diphosphatase
MIQVSAGIIIRDEMVLVCQRKKAARYPLQWEFPGGKREAGETPTECLHRELFEELAITAEVGPLFYTHSWNYPDSGSFEVFYFLILQYSGTLTNQAFERFEWIPLSDLMKIDMLEGNREVSAKMVRELKTESGK